MIEFLKQRKIVIIIGILGIILIGWKIYDSFSFEEIDSQEILVSDARDEELKSKEEEEEKMAVHITGEVKKPGVIKIKEGSRIEDIIKEAGGLTENADITNVNLAFVVEDGMKIRIPSQDDEEAEEIISEDSGKGVLISEKSQEVNNNIVNINTASQEKLEELPGIGPSIASKIVEYREQNGKFKDIEDIKNVTGIGDNKFAKIKELIKVK